MTAPGAGRPSPPVSVVVPCLNGIAYLGETLAGLETPPGLDVVVVDGGSTDGSVGAIRAWAAGRPSVRFTSEHDAGQADAINKGVAMATGDVVGWLNADDVLESGAIAIVADAFRRDPELDFVWGFCLVVDAQGTPLYVQNPFVRGFDTLRQHRNFVPQPGSFFRRSLFERFGPLDISYQYMFDYEFFLRLACHVKARFIPAVLARFRLHGGSKTGRAHREFLREERRAFRAHGGRWLSPFYLDLYRHRLVEVPADWLKAPLRRALWKGLGLSRGSRIRP